jgi:hypothetical protein
MDVDQQSRPNPLNPESGEPAEAAAAQKPHRDPWYQRTDFWLGPFLILLGVLVAGGMGWSWYSYGGWPQDVTRYGVVAVPGRQVLELPKGRVMLEHTDDVYACSHGVGHVKNAGLYALPNGTQIRIVPFDRNTSPLEITRLGGNHESQTGCRGHNDYGRIDTPAAGRYLVETTNARLGGFTRPPQRHGRMTPSARSSGPGIGFGEKPWTPLDSPLLGAILEGLLLIVLFSSPLFLLRRWPHIQQRLRRRNMRSS